MQFPSLMAVCSSTRPQGSARDWKLLSASLSNRETEHIGNEVAISAIHRGNVFYSEFNVLVQHLAGSHATIVYLS